MDLNSIQPLLMTQVNWPVFTEHVQNLLGYSPTRGLDAAKIELTNPAAFVASLDCENNPQRALRRAALSNILDHYFASFIMIIDNVDLVIELGTNQHLHIYTKRHGSNKFLCTLSGSMFEWYRSIIAYSQRESQHELRCIFNVLYDYFKKMGFSLIWSHYKRVQIKDKTFILEV